MEEVDTYQRLAFSVCAALAVGGGLLAGGLAGCSPSEDVAVAKRASRSSTIALSDDGAHVAMVNPDSGTLSVFETAGNTRVALIPTGKEPSSVALAADDKTAYVANRADGTVVRIKNFGTEDAAVDATVEVGAEPVGLALSPTGRQLFVAEFAESRVSVIDTSSMQIVASVPVDRPRALLVTNNLDANDGDEKLVVTQYFGTPVAGKESRDDGRVGHVLVFKVDGLQPANDISLAAVDSGFAKGGDATKGTVGASANQLSAIAQRRNRVYVTSVAASPEGPNRFDNNVFPVVYVADLDAGAEIKDASGTTNLARKIYDANPSPSAANPRFIPGDLADMDFVRNADGSDTDVAYTIGRAGDVMVRVTYGSSVTIGSTQNTTIDLAGNDQIGKCQAPTGIVVVDNTRAYVNCWITRRLGVVDLGAQALQQTVESSPAPASAAEAQVLRGKRFYFTGRARWSAAVANGAKGGEGWSACSSCHPDGLSDNITWSFGSGPRQTVSQDGTFSHGASAQKQRILNYTGIFEEHHDFERNTRDVSGGLGAITTAADPADCNKLDKETQVPLAINGTAIGGLGKPLKELADDPTVAVCGHKDWDDIEAFVRQIRPVHAAKTLAAASVERGRQVFVDGGCAKCHGGAGWTVSRRAFTPSGATNAALALQPFKRPGFFPQTWMYDNLGTDRTAISAQPAINVEDATGPAELAAVPIGQAACVLRNVGTFGLPGDVNGTNALEIRIAAGAAVRSEGRAGYNVPSLYGLSLNAPYLHHGQALSLEELFVDTRWQFHTNAGNANFSLELAQAGKLDDLVAFLRSIDETTPEFAIPTDPGTGASFDACP